jgi:hypothetical protein
MKLVELRDLLAARPASATRQEYLQAVLDENVLGKRTLTARRNTAQVLGELYALDPGVTVFRLLRHFWDLDAEGRPLLALRPSRHSAISNRRRQRSGPLRGGRCPRPTLGSGRPSGVPVACRDRAEENGQRSDSLVPLRY